MGFASVGERVSIDERAAFFGVPHVSLGDDCRIDCFALITAGPGEVRIGNNVHISAGAHIFGTGGVTIEDFGGLSGGGSIYSASDDFTSGYLTNPTVPDDLRNVRIAPVHFERHVLVGARSIVLPGVRLGVGSTVGALSLVHKDVPPYAVMAGTPARKVAERDANLLTSLEAEYLSRKANQQH